MTPSDLLALANSPNTSERTRAGALSAHVTLPYPPSVNHLYATVNGHRVLSKEGRQYKATASMMALAAGMRPLAGDIKVTIRVYRPRKAGDLDNTFKAVFDSLKGVGWADDRQITEINAKRFEDPANPRAEVTVEAVQKGLTQ